MSEIQDRRRHERYKARDDMLLVLLTDHFAQIGRIVDIGYGGLSCHYKERGNEISESCEVSIIFDDNGTFRYGPFKFSTNIISDEEIETLYRSANMKQCRMKFSNLSYHQKSWLEECIRNHTTGPF